MMDIATLKKYASNLTVLFVEDNSDIRNAFSAYLEKLFKEVGKAGDGAEGLEAYRDKLYDIVITDIMMPNMNGIEMIRQIKRIKPDQETIVISAYTEPEFFVESIRLGVSGYIIKPIDYDNITKTLSKSVMILNRENENALYRTQLETMVEQRTKEKLSLEFEKFEIFEQTLRSLVRLIENRDSYTGGHSQRVAKYSMRIAEMMGYGDEECRLLYRAGMLHDIGKVATPDTILLKPGRLTFLEFELIKEHVSVGYELLNKIPMYQPLAEIIKHHHERYDGKGYPDQLSGNAISPLSRIMIVADAFDAMTTNRIYKGRKSVDEALRELKEFRCQQFHPEVVDAAIKVLGDVEIAESISQIPHSAMEKQRFAYFYKDQISDALNADYLDYVLHRNTIEKTFTAAILICLRNFTQYNHQCGWKKGDELLSEFASYLIELFPKCLVFRIHGDDFILMSDGELAIDEASIRSLDFLKNSNIDVSIQRFDVMKESIENVRDLEKLI